MAKTSGLFVALASTAILCTAYVLYSRTAMDYQIESKQTDIVKGPGSGTDTALVAVPEAFRAYLRRSTTPVEPTEDQAAPEVVTITKRNNAPSVNTSTFAARSGTQRLATPPRSCASCSENSGVSAAMTVHSTKVGRLQHARL